MKLIFKKHKTTKRRWRYKLVSIDNYPADSIQRKHTELILHKDTFKEGKERLEIWIENGGKIL